jgi:cold shock CspA family protein
MKVQDLSIITFPTGKTPHVVNYTLSLRDDGTGFIMFKDTEDANKFQELPQEIADALTPPTGSYSGPSLIGKVYSGTVKNVLRGINAAFISTSEKKECFLPLDAIDPKRNNILKEGQEITVQVVKNPNSNHQGPVVEEVF